MVRRSHEVGAPRRPGAALAAFCCAALLGGGCAKTLVVRPPEPEDEVARYQREVTKVKFAIDVTKELIDRSRGQSYLADLYLRLAELYVEEARYQYFIAYEGQKRRNRAVTSVQASLLKKLAIGVYGRILDEFPDYPDNDKVLFYIAHEYRELGDYEQMTVFLRRVIEEYPKSVFANESLLVLGDYHFDRSELEQAEKYYRKIVNGPESPTHGMARYKLAWVRINKEDFKGALKLFEASIENLGAARRQAGPADSKPDADGNEKKKPEKHIVQPGRQIDLRREALIDLVYPYTEVHKKPVDTLAYFRRLADTRTTYLAALAKLANRWFVKGEYALASHVYREILNFGSDNEDSIEWARRLYDGVIKEKELKEVALDVELLVRVVSRRFYDWQLEEKARAQLFEEFEAYARDLGTKTQLLAEQKKDPEGQARAAAAYERYLTFFDRAPKAKDIRLNLAEARFAAKQYLEAGRAYEAVYAEAGDTERKQALYTAVIAFHNALKDPAKLPRLDLVQARAGLARAARLYIGSYPKEKELVGVKFNLARSLYDEGRFDDAAELFAALVDEYPATEEGSVSAELALDALRAKEDFVEMVRVGKKFAGDTRLSASVRADVSKIVASAESRALDTATLSAGNDREDAEKNLLEFAEQHKGDQLGERALINAFATARNSDDLDKVAAIGDQLIKRYPKSEVVPDVLATLGKMSAQAVDFERSARYLEEAGRFRKPNDPASVELLKAAATIKFHLGDVSGAKKAIDEMFERAQKGPQRREAALTAADLTEEAGDYRALAWALGVAAQEGARSASVEYRFGYAQLKSGRPVDAISHFKSAVEMGSKSSDPEERDAAAGGRYRLAQPAVEDFSRISAEGEAAPAMQKKFAALAQLEQQLFAVIELQSPRWAIGALQALSSVYEEGAAFLEKTQVPAGIDGANAEKYKAAIAQRAEGLRAKAKEARTACADKASELKVFTPTARACLAGEKTAGDPEERIAPAARRGAPPAAEATALRKRIAKNSKDYDALVRLAELYLGAGDPFAAKLVLDKASEGGANSATYNLRGVVAFQLGHPQEAYESFTQAIRADESNTRARLNLAALYRSFGFDKLAKVEQAQIPSALSVDRGDPGLIAGAGPKG